MKKSSSRSRNFACVVYPESAPADFREIIDSLHVPAFLSPLHDQDDKKPHYHVLFMYTSLKSVPQVVDDFSKFGGVGLECVRSLAAYARYLCHLDNPEKHAYAPSDVVSFCGCDYNSIAVSANDKYFMLKEVLVFIKQSGLLSFSSLVDYTLSERPDLFPVVHDNTVFIKEYQKSLRWTLDVGHNLCYPDRGGD